jgi:hypothetical protein
MIPEMANFLLTFIAAFRINIAGDAGAAQKAICGWGGITMGVKSHSTKKIIDDLSEVDLSRQRKYQIRRLREGLCIICGQKGYNGTGLCLDHNRKHGIKNPGSKKSHPKKWLKPPTA